MRRVFISAAALMCGVIAAAATFLVGLAVAPSMTCPRCDGSGLCSLMACYVDIRSHVVVAVLVGLVASVLGYLAFRRWARSRT
jgi:acetyl-CoA acetyltransferase